MWPRNIAGRKWHRCVLISAIIVLAVYVLGRLRIYKYEHTPDKFAPSSVNTPAAT